MLQLNLKDPGSKPSGCLVVLRTQPYYEASGGQECKIGNHKHQVRKTSPLIMIKIGCGAAK